MGNPSPDTSGITAFAFYSFYVGALSGKSFIHPAAVKDVQYIKEEENKLSSCARDYLAFSHMLEHAHHPRRPGRKLKINIAFFALLPK